MRRIRMGEGLSVYVGDDKTGKSTLIELIVHLLYPDPIEPATDVFISSQRGPCRASLLLGKRDADRFRLVKDLTSGKTALSKWNPTSSNFNAISASPPEITQYLGGQLGLVQQDILQELFVLKTSDFPSVVMQAQAISPMSGLPASSVNKVGHAIGSATMQKTAPVRQNFPGFQGLDPSENVLPDNPDEIQAQIEILKKDLDLARNVDEWQFELDGLQSKLFALEDKTKTAKQASQKIAEIEAKLQPFMKLTELPANFEHRVRSYEKDQEKLERDLARLSEDHKKWEALVQEISDRTIWKDKIFLSGLLLGVFSLVAGVVGFVYWDWLRYVALLDLVGFGMVVVSGFRHLDAQSTSESRSARLKMVEERRVKLRREFELATTLVRKTLVETGVETPKQLIEQYNRRNRIVQELDEARENLKRIHLQENLDAVESQKKDLEKQVDDLEQKLSAAGGLMMSTSEMEKRIESMEGKLRSLNSPETVERNDRPPEFAYDLGSDLSPIGVWDRSGGTESAFHGAASMDHPCEKLLFKAKDLFLVEWDRIQPALEQRTSQYLSALTEKEYSRIELGASGSITCQEAQSGQKIAHVALPAAVQDLVYLALSFSLVEASSLRSIHPLLLDDPFLRISPKLYGLIGKMIAGIGQKTQVVLLTKQSQWARFTKAAYRI